MMGIKEAQAHLDQNVLGQLRRGSPGTSILSLAGGVFSATAWPGQRPLPYLAQLGTRKSRLETNTKIGPFQPF